MGLNNKPTPLNPVHPLILNPSNAARYPTNVIQSG